MRAPLFVPALALVFCAACSTAGGSAYYSDPAERLRPLSTRGPLPALVWYFVPDEGGPTQLLLAAYADGRLIFRAPEGEGYLTLGDSALAARLRGTTSERAAFASLPGVRMPEGWNALGGGTETFCLWVGDAMRCHRLTDPWGEHVGRSADEACAGWAHNTTSFHGRRSWAQCRQLNATHASIPAALAMPYRRAYDAVRERSSNVSPWVPERVLLSVWEAGCRGGPQTPWPEGVPLPSAGELSGRTDWGEVRQLAVTAEQARRLREVDLASFTGCLVVDGAPWAWMAYFQVPNLQMLWAWGE